MFPKSIELPSHILKAREERSDAVLRVTKLSILIRSLIIVCEMAGFFWFDSHTLLIDAIDGAFDVTTSFFLLFCIKYASRPPDRNHPFGHGRLEPLAGLQLGLILTAIGGFLFFKEIWADFGLKEVAAISPLAALIPLGAFLLLELTGLKMKKLAQQLRSPALLAEARHLRLDSLNTVIAAITLLLAASMPTWSARLDECGALLIAACMTYIGISGCKKNLDQLLDRKPEEDLFKLVREAALKTEGVKDTEKIRIQSYGPNAHIAIDIEVESSLSVEEAHLISQNVRVEIQKEWPDVQDVIVHIEPYYPGDH
ncbi:MAG: hypothetical protein K0S07_503 [Chlamydiales bacterium]|jgi:cation diffusion facilitator family transporter|nr:hypothetical protein [Chlamydiales bacterium]